jgi:predicted DsbA family dithiol-disulfide isomerase
MNARVSIDFVSDVSCPWCVIGLRALEQAVANLHEEVDAEIRFQPFELNPQMPPEGQDLDEHLLQKYGATPEQFAGTRRAISERGEELGFIFRMDRRNRIYNTFDAHRLLHWAEEEGRQLELKHALFRVYFTEGENPGDHAVLTRVAGEVGLDAARAAAILATDEYADEVRERERYWTSVGISAVPAVIVNGKYLIQGGQPASTFEQALREIAAKGEE